MLSLHPRPWILLVLFAATMLVACESQPKPAVRSPLINPKSVARVPNKPVGVAKGLNPGRVVWVHDPSAVDWDGETGHWYDPVNFDQPVIDAMMSQSICALAGKKNERDAWRALFRHFNQVHGRGNHSYRPGEKIMIKPNFSCMHKDNDPIDRHWDEAVITTPPMIEALLHHLIDIAGVRQADITIGDTTAYFGPHFYNPLHARFPGVTYLAFKSYDGRVGATYSDHPFYWSTPGAAGKAQDYAPLQYAQATYLINMAQLKAHNAGGITLCGKNHYGSMIRIPVDKTPDGRDYYSLHTTLSSEQFGKPGYGYYHAMVDMMGHADYGDKTVLYLIDGLFGGWDAIWSSWQGSKPNLMWQSPPFNNHWPCSLLVSQDPVAIDSVGHDIWWEEAPFKPYHFARNPGAEDYLIEAALADNPPSGTFYDPNHATPTKRLESLGVYECWNNPKDRQYSRNLGTGDGIELIYRDAGTTGAHK